MGGRPRLSLGLEVPERIAPGSFVVASVELSNAGVAALPVARHPSQEGGDLWMRISRPRGLPARVLGPYAFAGSPRALVLEPGHCLRFGVNLSGSDADTGFDLPGRYRVRALYDPGTGPVESGEQVFTVAATAGAAGGERGPGSPDGHTAPPDTAAMLCQLVLLAASLHKSSATAGVRARAAFMLDQAIVRFGAVPVAVAVTALFPHHTPGRAVLAGLFEACLAGVPGAHAARAIIHGAPFDPAAPGVLEPPPRVVRH